MLDNLEKLLNSVQVNRLTALILVMVQFWESRSRIYALALIVILVAKHGVGNVFEGSNVS